MSETRKTIRPDQLEKTTIINDDDIFILYSISDGKYYAIELSFLRTIFGAGDDGIVKVDSFTFTGNQATYPIQSTILIEKVVITPPTECTVIIGTSLNNDDILPESNLQANTSSVFDLNFFSQQNQTFYISGFVPNTKFQFMKIITQQ